MDSDHDSYHFPKCQTYAYTRFENGCTENSTQKLLTKYSTEENNKHVICRPGGPYWEKLCPRSWYGPRPAASGRTQDLWHSFPQYGPPGRQITYIYLPEGETCANRGNTQSKFNCNVSYCKLHSAPRLAMLYAGCVHLKIC